MPRWPHRRPRICTSECRLRWRLHTQRRRGPAWAVATAEFAVPKSHSVWQNSSKLRSTTIFHPSVGCHACQACTDFVELNDGRRITIEYKSSRTFDCIDAELGRGGQEVTGQSTRDLKQRARKAIRQRTFTSRIFDLGRSSGGDVAVEQEDRAVVRCQRHDLPSNFFGVAVA